MDRAYRLSYCKKCTLRDFSPKHGIICSLTNAPAEFQENCESFNEDPREAENIKIQEKLVEKDVQSSDTLGLSRIGIKNGLVAGLIAIVVALAWLIVGIINGYIFIYPPILLILGLIVFIKGLKNMKSKRLKGDETILDNDL
jgi:hypothetical protein